MGAKPTDGMKDEARRYRAWKEEGRKGGTDVAARRAGQILSGDELSDETIRTMSAWFARHEVDKQAEGFSPGEEGYPSPGRVAWAAWGGDPGKTWSDALVARMDSDRELTMDEALEMERPYPNEHAARLRDPGQYDRFRRRNDAAGKGVDFIFGIKEGEDGAELQAIRFRLTEFTAAEARAWLRERDYEPLEFEEATGERSKVEQIEAEPVTAERAAPDALQEGDFVSWDSSGGRARGRIEHVMRDGTLGVPGTEFSIDASEEDPAALIRIYRDGEATETMVGHRFSTLTKIEPIGDRSLEGKYQRTESVQFRAVDDRSFEFPFSSEYPVMRYFGNEVLSHEVDAADLGRLNDGAPLLFNHDPDRVVGVVERAWVDGEKKRGYAKVRFSRNSFAQEILADVRDNILRGISFGYSIDKMEERGGDFVATRWSPYEVSVVSIPADPTIGIGRSLNDETNVQAATAASPTPEPEMENTPDLEVIRSKAAEAERTRIAAISALGDKHQMQDLARELIEGGRTLDEARAAVLEKLGSQPMEEPIRSADITSNDVGLSDKETRSFSFARALNYLANPSDASARRAAEFEIEVGKAAAQKYERASNGIVIPNEVLRRDLVVGTPTAGGNLVADELLAGSFIDLLRNRLALAQAGVTMLTGLQGNISIPRQTSAATAYWVGENASPTESQQAIDQVNMTPKTVGAYVDYSRRLLLQSSIDVEGMIRNDLARVIALELDRAGIYGTGSSNQPLGLTNTTGIGSQTITTYGTFEEYIGMETDVASANADAGSLRYIVNAAARGALKSTAKSSSAVAAGFVFEDGEINGYPVIVSNQLANNDALFGDFSMMIMGMWSGLDLTVDPYAGATAGTVRVIALQDVDVAVKQPGAFCLGT
jgi:HK97 family phage major capsid protein/HK97 family phage prohead protease